MDALRSPTLKKGLRQLTQEEKDESKSPSRGKSIKRVSAEREVCVCVLEYGTETTPINRHTRRTSPSHPCSA